MKRLWMGVMMVGLVPALLAAGPAPAPCDSCAPCAGGCDSAKGCGKSFKEKFLRWLGYRPRYCRSCKWQCDRPTPPLYTFFPPCPEWRQPPHFSCSGPCLRRDIHVGGRHRRARCSDCCEKECPTTCQQAKAADEKKAGVEKPPTKVAKAPAPQVTRVFKPVVKPEPRPEVVAEVVVEDESEAKWFPRIRKWFARKKEPAAPRGFRPVPRGPYVRAYDRPWLRWLRGDDIFDPSLKAPPLYPGSDWGPVYQSGHRMFASPTGHGVPGATH